MTTLKIRRFAAVLLLTALCAPVTPSAAQVTTRTDEDPPNAYAIGPGDILEISVWKNPELTSTVPVRPDGRISVPLLGDVQAAGMTPLALKQTLTDGYKEYVTAPGVSVVVKEIHSRKIYVTGEVATPGVYDLQPRAKLMQAIALAGGVTPYAKGRVIVLRDSRDGKQDRRYEIAISSIISGKKPQDNLLLQPGDTLVVP
ncbi:MAG TPA: polysaccharide biosynthesis/export family protein [Thermoanaerobaculia bacterium]|jgi:polysaccharide export outer membrane protein|nr:polysaccharide biosynthesis/export family protein [Thermoanaerobaculia bacterium]